MHVIDHPLTKYGAALVYYRAELSPDEIATPQKWLDTIIHLLEEGLDHFRLRAQGDPETMDEIKFDYIPAKEIERDKLKGNPSKGIYLAPNIMTVDLKTTGSWGGIKKLIETLGKLKDKPEKLFSERVDLTMSLAPLASKLNNGNASQSNPKADLFNAALSAITTITEQKPCLGYRKSQKESPTPTAIIPDLEIHDLYDFIEVFDNMRSSQTSNLLTKSVYRAENQKPGYTRPPIYNGNFPYAPNNSYFGPVALLGAVGRWIREAENTPWAARGEGVLEKLKGQALYLISYGDAQTQHVGHFAIDLAKEGRLSDIVRDFLQVDLLGEQINRPDESKQQLYSLMCSRFLAQTNSFNFQNFKAIRCEYGFRRTYRTREGKDAFFFDYSENIDYFFKQYFTMKEQIDREIVASAHELGRWLNFIAFKVAEDAVKESQQDYKNKRRKEKAKVLAEMESTAMSSKTADEMIQRVITRAGRLSYYDAPEEGSTFIEACLAGDLDSDARKSFEKSRNLLLIFSRLRSKMEKKEAPITEEETNTTETVQTKE